MKIKNLRKNLIIIIIVLCIFITAHISFSFFYYWNNVPNDICPHSNKTDVLFFCSKYDKRCVNVKLQYVWVWGKNDVNIKDVCFGKGCDEVKPNFWQIIGVFPRSAYQVKHQYDWIWVEKYNVTSFPSLYNCETHKFEKWWGEQEIEDVQGGVYYGRSEKNIF